MGISDHRARSAQRGSALLMVLWVSAALAAIAFSLSNTVLGETQRTSTDVDGLRSYYLASGGLLRAEYEVLWSFQNPDRAGAKRDSARVDYTFPAGDVRVEIIPEAAKLDVNLAPPEELYRLLLALGQETGRAREIALAILDWRAPAPEGDAFDQYYLSLTPSFRARHASFEEIEELLQVKGVTPDIFHGTYVPASPEGSPSGLRLIPRPGLADCLSVFGGSTVDVNTASPAVLAAIGLTADVINALVERRRVKPFTQDDFSTARQSSGDAAGRLRVGGNSIVTLRATARLRLPNGQLSDLRRTVAAQVKYMPTGFDAPIHILRWYDTAWAN